MRHKPERSGVGRTRQPLIPWLSVWLVLPFILTSPCLTGAELEGRITNEKGEPLSYASVYVKGTTTGTTTNEQGDYSLTLKPGTYTIVFQYMGYQQKTRSLSLQPGEVKTLNVTLLSRAYETDPVTVSGRDPAYRIIENAIAKRETYLKAVTTYECDLYTKATVGADSAVNSPLIDSADLPPGYFYFSESVSQLQYRYPDDYREEVLSSKVSGRDEAATLNFAFNTPTTFYKNLIEQLPARRPLVCPIADNALSYYDYRLINTYNDKGSRVHRIRVIPKRSTDPVFRGNMHITAETWRIHSLELKATKANGVQPFDTIRVRQTYLPVNDSTWRLYNQHFRLTGQFVGLPLTAKALAQFTDYKLNPDWTKDPFDEAVVSIPDTATEQDSAYWETIRPFELTANEKRDYSIKDSLQKVRTQPSYIDSVDSVRNQLSVTDLLTGYQYQRRTRDIAFEVPSPLFSLLRFNTVEGLSQQLRLTLTKTAEEGPDWQFEPFVRYGFANDQLNGGLAVDYSVWSVKGGRNVFQFQEPPPIAPFLNTSYTLFDGRNFARFYQKAYLTAAYSGDEWGNGWFPRLLVSFEERQPLSNNTAYTFAETESYASNIPEHPYFSSNGNGNGNNTSIRQNFTNHQALLIEAGMRFKPGLEYMRIKGEKVNMGTSYPTLSLNYRKAVGGIGSGSAEYDYVEAGIKGDADFKLLGQLDYQASAGQFISQERVPFMDYRHFQGHEVRFQPQSVQDFQLLSYYEQSTTAPFLEAHIKHDFSGFIWNKLPLARRLPWQVTGVGHTLQQEHTFYAEWGVGLTDLIGVAGTRFLGFYYFQGHRVGPAGLSTSSDGFRITLKGLLGQL